MAINHIKPQTQAIFWACAVALFILVIMLFKAVLLPFVLGIAVAYLLNPLVEKFAAIGIARRPASMMILGGFLILVVAFLGAVIPILIREAAQLGEELPEYIRKIMEILAPFTAMIDQYVGGHDEESLKKLLAENSGSAANVANAILGKIAQGSQAIFDMVSVIIFMPVVAYFMMVEWERICAWVRDLIPRHAEEVVMELLHEINKKLSGFVRGQISVAVFLGLAYALALGLAGLKYGILIGLCSGLLSVIPMVGSAIGLIVSVAVAWFQSGDLAFVAMIAGIFIAGQLIEGNYLTPKLVGDSVGLHPLWVFFALLAGGSLLGLLGMFLAVPIAATIGVLLSFALHSYKKSGYYRAGHAEGEDPASDEIKPDAPKKTRKKKV